MFSVSIAVSPAAAAKDTKKQRTLKEQRLGMEMKRMYILKLFNDFHVKAAKKIRKNKLLKKGMKVALRHMVLGVLTGGAGNLISSATWDAWDCYDAVDMVTMISDLSEASECAQDLIVEWEDVDFYDDVEDMSEIPGTFYDYISNTYYLENVPVTVEFYDIKKLSDRELAQRLADTLKTTKKIIESLQKWSKSKRSKSE